MTCLVTARVELRLNDGFGHWDSCVHDGLTLGISLDLRPSCVPDTPGEETEGVWELPEGKGKNMGCQTLEVGSRQEPTQ